MSTTAQTVNWPRITSDLLFILPLASALAGFDWQALVPGTPGIITAIAVGALAKTLAGFAQDPHLSNWEDAFGLLLIFLGILGTGFSANPGFLEWGTVLGFLTKGLGFLQTGLNIEDALLCVGAIITGYATLTGDSQLFMVGSLIALVGKTMPSIGTAGMAGNPKATAAPPST